MLAVGCLLEVFAVVRPVEKALKTVAYVGVWLQSLRMNGVESTVGLGRDDALWMGWGMEHGRSLLMLGTLIARTHCVFAVASEGCHKLGGRSGLVMYQFWNLTRR